MIPSSVAKNRDWVQCAQVSVEFQSFIFDLELRVAR